jgi:hypothetical protein
MIDLLDEERFDFIPEAEKGFIRAFNAEMNRLGYGFGSTIGSGYCWGRYMLIYRRVGVKSERVFARLYIRDTDILLRLFLNDIDRHRSYIESAPAHIQNVFVGPNGDCQHCHNDKGGTCRFRKSYTLHDRSIEKCNGLVFEFPEPDMRKLSDYLALFSEFYPDKKR